ncbi:hypothetical protein O9H85_04395 [Paenibacillus filicis]|uniref:HAD family hydrolase n=1 Tax=Paenibacillus gyeongsangnamensis TaxID=3388067 RepID=A0ABT4Q4A8_9BACL|nr:HAD family hydrolase [Paenibacillus filicis]MCZ8511682.1 hypothetical protein [Paenibacillus filicis]
MNTISYEWTELWLSDRYLASLRDSIEHYRIISLDIFDTLLFRAAGAPADIFEKTGEKAGTLGVLSKPLHPKEFRYIREQAERAARSRGGRQLYMEVTLADIYEQIPAALMDREALMKLELATEAEFGYLNPAVVSLMRYGKSRGCCIVLVSDMYLNSAQMLDLLTAVGLQLSWIDCLLISCEHGCSKVDGGLFDKLLALYPDVPPSSIVHIGDNISADIRGAESRRIDTLYYGVVPESFESLFHWEEVRYGAVLPEIKSLRKWAAQTLPDSPLDEASLEYYRIGTTILGPFLHALCEWAVELCVQENYPAIHPLMREAHVLAPMLERVISRRGLELMVYPVNISRQAAFLPSMDSFGETELERLMGLNWVKVTDLFVILDLESEIGHFRPYADMSVRDIRLLFDEAGVAIADRLKSYLLQEEFVRKIESRIKLQRELLIDHLRQHCGGFESPIVTLDIGFNGTIQSSLQAIVMKAGYDVPMVHLMAVGTERASDYLLRGLDLRCYFGSAGSEADLAGKIARSPAFLEELMMGSFGSTLKYERSGSGEVRPVLADLAHEQQEFAYKEACQQGIRRFQEAAAFFDKAKPGLLPDPSRDRRQWCLPLHRAIDMPTPREAQLLGSLTHQDNFCGTQIAPICDRIDDRWFAQGGARFLDMCNYGSSVFSANWPQGLLTLHDPDFLYRYYVQFRDRFGRQALLYDMIVRLKRDGVDVFNIYGAGELSEALLQLSAVHGLPAVRLSDADSLKQAVGQDVHVYVTATLNDFELFSTDIEKAYRHQAPGRHPVIYSFLE